MRKWLLLYKQQIEGQTKKGKIKRLVDFWSALMMDMVTGYGVFDC